MPVCVNELLLYNEQVKSLSVIIPTHKRADLLASCLEYLDRQTAKEELEIIVVSDGPDKDTTELLRHWNTTIPLKFTEIPKSQQGSARNKGVEMATSPLVLFIGDDTMLTPGACAIHIETHRTLAASGTKAAVLGRMEWDPAITITPVMRWLDASSRIFHSFPLRQLEGAGWQFDYPAIDAHAQDLVPTDLQDRFTYTIHISVPTDLARAHPFRTDITEYGWEDILWGGALRDAGVRLFYAKDAIAYHRHVIDTHDSLKRMETLGGSLVRVTKMDASLNRMPTPWKLFGYRLIGLLPTMRGAHARAFLRGIRKAR